MSRECRDCGAAMEYRMGRPPIRCRPCAQEDARRRHRVNPAYAAGMCERCSTAIDLGRGNQRRYCSCCRSEVGREQRRAWFAARPDYMQRYMEKHGLRLYLRARGVSQERYDALVAEQGGRCASCGESCERLVLDHDHACCNFDPTTGQPWCGQCIRGLLCNGCNSAIGFLRDDPERAKAAATYLEQRVRVSR